MVLRHSWLDKHMVFFELEQGWLAIKIHNTATLTLKFKIGYVTIFLPNASVVPCNNAETCSKWFNLERGATTPQARENLTKRIGFGRTSSRENSSPDPPFLSQTLD